MIFPSFLLVSVLSHENKSDVSPFRILSLNDLAKNDSFLHFPQKRLDNTILPPFAEKVYSVSIFCPFDLYFFPIFALVGAFFAYKGGTCSVALFN